MVEDGTDTTLILMIVLVAFVLLLSMLLDGYQRVLDTLIEDLEDD